MKRQLSLLAAGLLLASACVGPTPAQPWSAQFEGAATWFSRNDVAVPGDTGTRLSLDDTTGTGPVPSGRIYLGYRPAARHEWRALAAPLSISGNDVLSDPVSFGGENFVAGAQTNASYRFDSYRLTWRYLLHESDDWRWQVGLTGKIRDAELELRQGGTSARKTDLGFVPLLHTAVEWRFADDWRMLLDVDAAWAPQGRATDATLQLRRTLGEHLDLGFGYRTIEGGADNDEVFTFSWLHQAVVSIGVRF
ncbi:MAG: hypothetical protein ACI85K_002191 [Hyphomicrobiaceae bacterium]